MTVSSSQTTVIAALPDIQAAAALAVRRARKHAASQLEQVGQDDQDNPSLTALAADAGDSIPTAEDVAQSLTEELLADSAPDTDAASLRRAAGRITVRAIRAAKKARGITAERGVRGTLSRMIPEKVLAEMTADQRADVAREQTSGTFSADDPRRDEKVWAVLRAHSRPNTADGKQIQRGVSPTANLGWSWEPARGPFIRHRDSGAGISAHTVGASSDALTALHAQLRREIMSAVLDYLPEWEAAWGTADAAREMARQILLMEWADAATTARAADKSAPRLPALVESDGRVRWSAVEHAVTVGMTTKQAARTLRRAVCERFGVPYTDRKSPLALGNAVLAAIGRECDPFTRRSAHVAEHGDGMTYPLGTPFAVQLATRGMLAPHARTLTYWHDPRAVGVHRVNVTPRMAAPIPRYTEPLWSRDGFTARPVGRYSTARTTWRVVPASAMGGTVRVLRPLVLRGREGDRVSKDGRTLIPAPLAAAGGAHTPRVGKPRHGAHRVTAGPYAGSAIAPTYGMPHAVENAADAHERGQRGWALMARVLAAQGELVGTGTACAWSDAG